MPETFGKADRISMKTRINLAVMVTVALTLICATLTMAQQAAPGLNAPLSGP